MDLLKVRDLKTYFKIKAGTVKAVDGISFTLKEGESLGLVGESGCGKTTIALSITQLLPPEGVIAGGEIYFEGTNLLELTEEEIRAKRWKDISIIFQGAMNALNPVMKVGDQVAEACIYHEGIGQDAARKRVKELFSLVEIDESRIDDYPHEFSGGMKQRAVIAMALACGPKIVIGDEPTTALDVMIQAQILELLNRLRREMSMSMIIITHDLSILGETCDKVAVVYAGKIVEIGEVGTIYEEHTHPYTEKLVKAFPNIYGKREMTASIPGTPPNLIDPPTGCRFHPRCELATEKCRLVEPKLKLIGGEHYAACHLRGDNDE
jgi:oligopeptide/dipeptide ABC transporter ATP-binding protein